MIRFLFRTDVHAADKNPVSWKGDYLGEIFDSLNQVGELARTHSVAAVLDGGDFFHVKTAIRNSHALVIRTAVTHSGYPCPTFSIEGNHDIVGNNLETIDQQPLGVLYSAGVFRHLREEVFEENGVRVRVVGLPYHPSRDLREIQEFRKKPGDDALIAVIHALAAEDPPDHVDEFFGEPVFRYRNLVFEGGPDVFCFGHWHKDQGIVEIEGRHFVNQGALSRGALTRENTERIPKVSLIEVSKAGVNVRAIPLNVAPASEVFNFERKERQEREHLVIDQFVAELEANLQVDPSQDVSATVKTMSLAPEVRDRALSYLEKART